MKKIAFIKRLTMSFTLCLLLGAGALAYAATSATLVKGKAPGGYTTVLVKGSESKSSSSASFSVSVPASGTGSSRLYEVSTSTGKLAGAVVLAIKKGKNLYSYSDAKKQKICKGSGAAAVMGLKVPSGKTLSVGSIKYSSADGVFYLVKQGEKKTLNLSALANVTSTCVPKASGKNLGVVSKPGAARVRGGRADNRRVIALAAADGDSDGDGLQDPLDADDNNNGVLDPYDTQTQSAQGELRFFSNLKVGLESSLNVNTGAGIDQAQIDSLVSQSATLAIAVVGQNSEKTELECGGLSYCSVGGTGVGLESGQFPAADGSKVITKGGTGDFQLKPGAIASDIGSGDVLTEIVTHADNSTEQVTGMLNFIFNTTPAIKTVSVNGAAATTITYPAHIGDPGTMNNCFVAPSTGPVSLDITAWRPQRPGISGVGEGAYVDIGNSLITIDMPNPPCNGSCGGQGPGNCTASAYSTTDPNLTSDSNGLKDTKADQDADASNTFSFSIDLVSCLQNAHSGPIAWNSGETVSFDLQMRNATGDNAAQKICVRRQ